MIKVLDKQFSVFITEQEIHQIIDRIADELNNDFKELNPIFLIILNGGLMFAADLLRKFNGPCEIHGVKITSYVGMESTGKVQVSEQWSFNPTNRDVVIIEDIVDTGKTLSEFITLLEKHSPLSVKIVSLLYKPQNIVHQVNVEYIGKEIGSSFVIGYGLDYNEQGRNLPEIYVLESLDK